MKLGLLSFGQWWAWICLLGVSITAIVLGQVNFVGAKDNSPWEQFAGDVRQLTKDNGMSLEQLTKTVELAYYDRWHDRSALRNSFNSDDARRVFTFIHSGKGMEELLAGVPKPQLDPRVVGLIAYVLDCTEPKCLDMYRDFVSARPDVRLPGETVEGAARRLYREHLGLTSRRNGSSTMSPTRVPEKPSNPDPIPMPIPSLPKLPPPLPRLPRLPLFFP